MRGKLKALYYFSRPHTIVGTTISVTALWLLAAGLNGGTALRPGLWAAALLSCLGANIYIVGLNQLTDVGIDRINKPYLPLASGAFSRAEGWGLSIGGLLLSVAVAVFQGEFLLLTVGLSLLLGTAYSLPPIRLKRFPFWAAFCIIAVRGLIVNTLLFLHFQRMLGGGAALPLLILALAGLMFVFGMVIAIFKDMPDLEGDQQYHIRTFSLAWGVRRVFHIGNALLSLAILLVLIVAVSADTGASVPVLVVAQLVILGLLYRAAARVDLARKASIGRYYQFIWRLFFLEYAVFALAGWLGHFL